MSGFCPDCGNTACVCDEVKAERERLADEGWVEGSLLYWRNRAEQAEARATAAELGLVQMREALEASAGVSLDDGTGCWCFNARLDMTHQHESSCQRARATLAASDGQGAALLEAALAELLVALEWYGDADNWVCEDHHVGHCGPEDCSSAIDSDEGQRARTALAAWQQARRVSAPTQEVAGS